MILITDVIMSTPKMASIVSEATYLPSLKEKAVKPMSLTAMSSQKSVWKRTLDARQGLSAG